MIFAGPGPEEVRKRRSWRVSGAFAAVRSLAGVVLQRKKKASCLMENTGRKLFLFITWIFLLVSNHSANIQMDWN